MPGRELDDLFDELESLETEVSDPDAREHVEAAIAAAEDVEAELGSGSAFGNVIRGYDRSDVAETLLGSVLFGIPMAVESGTVDAGAYLAARPLFLLATVAVTMALVYGVLYVAEYQDVRVQNPIFGVLPRRFVGVLGIAFATAGVLLTVWGTVDWTTPLPAFGACVVAFAPMALGAALGDILPGS